MIRRFYTRFNIKIDDKIIHAFDDNGSDKINVSMHFVQNELCMLQCAHL